MDTAAAGNKYRRRQELPMAARLRHIAISVPDPEKAAKFFEEAFGMKIAGRAGVGLYVTDGTVNVALLKFPGEVRFLGRPLRSHSFRHVGGRSRRSGQEGGGCGRLLLHGPRRRKSKHLLRGQI